jgi:hypothetical protein
MPEEVRKPPSRWSGDWRRLNRWFYRSRPKIAVIAAFTVACLIGLAAASLGIQSVGGAEAAARAGP